MKAIVYKNQDNNKLPVASCELQVVSYYFKNIRLRVASSLFQEHPFTRREFVILRTFVYASRVRCYELQF